MPSRPMRERERQTDRERGRMAVCILNICIITAQTLYPTAKQPSVPIALETELTPAKVRTLWRGNEKSLVKRSFGCLDELRDKMKHMKTCVTEEFLMTRNSRNYSIEGSKPNCNGISVI